MTTSIADIRVTIGPLSEALADADIQSFIDMVDAIALATLANCAYSATMQNAIERYLVAHFIQLGWDNGGIVRKRTGDSEEQYRTPSTNATGLNSTSFGQQALALDVKGCLASLSANPLKAQFRVV